MQGGTADELTDNLARAFAGTPTIKHCYEVQEWKFNTRLLAYLAKAGYQHLLLSRRDEVGRVLSFFLARQTGIWEKSMVGDAYARINAGDVQLKPFNLKRVERRFVADAEVTAKLKQEMPKRSIRYTEAIFEDLFQGDPDSRLASFRKLTNKLGFSQESIGRHKELIDELLFRSSHYCPVNDSLASGN